MTGIAVQQANARPLRDDRLGRMTPSAIREVHNFGAGLRARQPQRQFIALHFGEGDLGTPDFIVEAGVKALREGAVFYENNPGRPDLTAALTRHFNTRLDLGLTEHQFVVTCGGVQAIHLAMLGLLAPGDEVINITPAWPNFREAATIAGARVHDLPLAFDEEAAVFRLDEAALRRMAGDLERLRMVVVNSPSNPTGYVMTEEEQERLLEFCRQRGAYLLADEMYERIVFTAQPHKSFLQLQKAQDRLVVINGFSKTYAMTGWRLGYLIAAPTLAPRLAEMQEFVTSCAPAMAQVAAITALEEGEAYVAQSRSRYEELRNLTLTRLRAMKGVTVSRPDGAFYVYFRAPGSEDSLAFCKSFLSESGVSLAPGKAFGAGGEGWLRLCFAKEPKLLKLALDHLEAFLSDSKGKSRGHTSESAAF